MDSGITRRGAVIGAVATTVAATMSGKLSAADRPDPTSPVQISSGKIRGLRRAGVSSFLGMPYGADTQATRFHLPVAAPAWPGVRDCFAPGPIAPQGLSSSGPAKPEWTAVFADHGETESENCLSLNVYTTGPDPAAKRPVMVWLHGGGFSTGAGATSFSDGSALARRGDVVVVSINHRLDALGYLYLGAFHDDFADSGNLGQHDQVLALRWIRDNISAFGGDLGNVTLFGVSGGGCKISTMLATPSAKGLFHKAIIQSGPAPVLHSRDQAIEVAEQVLKRLNVQKGDVHRLTAIDRTALMKAGANLDHPTSAPLNRSPLFAMVDGRLVPVHPFDPAAAETARDVPIMIGTTLDEATRFLYPPMPGYVRMSETEAQAAFRRTLGDAGPAAYAIKRAERPGASPGFLYIDLMSDMFAWADSIRIAERKVAQGTTPVYMYRLDYASPALGGALGSTHGIDVPLVFDNVAASRALLGPGPAPEKCAAAMARAWLAFARTGNPSQPGLAWPRYSLEDRKTMIFNDDSQLESDPHKGSRQFWTARA